MASLSTALLLLAAAAGTWTCASAHLAHSSSIFNIVDYGAVNDNRTINTQFIQAAIDAAAAAGGGLVLVPAGGAFKTATLSLRSNVFLYLPTGSVLHGSSSLDDYTAVSGGEWGWWDVLHTANASNTGILGDVGGNGTLSGPMWQMISSYDPVNNQLQPVTWAGQYDCIGECRPRLVVFEDCTDVVVSHVRLTDSADWTQLYRRVSNVSLLNLTVWGSQQWPNNDAVDFESCSSVTVRGFTSFTGDDGIVLASGNTNTMQHPWPEPPGEYSPTVGVLIEDAVISSYSSGIKWEAIFQPWHGDVRDVTVRNVVIHDSARGIGFQQRTGYGAWTNVSFVNVSVVRTKGIQGGNWWGEGEALWMTSLPEGPTLVSPLGGIHGVSFQDVVLQGEQGALVMCRDQGNASSSSGTTGPGITGLSFSNVSVVVGVYGNATRPGVHDFRPTDPGAASPGSTQANVTGWWFEHVGGVTIEGGEVRFEGPHQPYWQPGTTCIASTPDSSISMPVGLPCYPAAKEEDGAGL